MRIRASRLVANSTVFVLILSCLVTVTAAGDLMMIVSDPASPSGGDVTIKAHREGQGHRVTLWDDDEEGGATLAAANAADLVIVSESISSDRLGSEINATPTGVVNCEPFTYDDVQWTGAVTDADFGRVFDVTDIRVNDPAHPLAAGLSGLVTVDSAPGRISFGVPVASAHVIATANHDGTSTPAIFGYDIGEPLFDGSPSPGTRVGFFLHDAETNDDEPNLAGLSLFDAAVAYAIPEPGSVMLMAVGLVSGVLWMKRHRFC